MSAAAALHLQGIAKAYPCAYSATGLGMPVLQDLACTIAPGEHVAIMGPSGSGKSTLLHILGLLDRPTAGTYTLQGQAVQALSVNQLATLRNQLFGFVFQSYFLLPRLSVWQNVALPFQYRDLLPAERRRLALQQLAAFDLADKAEVKPETLSGGQQQRVALARALVTQPQIILADEPTGALDSATGAQVLERLLNVEHTRGATVILITHDAKVAAHCNRTLHLLDGRFL